MNASRKAPPGSRWVDATNVQQPNISPRAAEPDHARNNAMSTAFSICQSCHMRVCRLLLMLLGAAQMWSVSVPALANTPNLRLAIERDYAPFIFSGADGQPQGLSMDILSLVLRQSGLQVQPLPAQPLAVLLDDLREQRADLITSLRSTPQRAEFLVFSRPYIEVPAILIIGRSVSSTDARKGLRGLANQPVAVGKGYGVEQPMRQRYPEVRWQAVEDDAMALRGVAEGRFAGAVADAASVAYLIRRDGHKDLSPAGRVGFDYPLSFALSKAHAELMPRIDHAIQSVPQAERQAVIDRWMGDLDLNAFDQHPPWLLWSGTALALTGALLIGWRWRRRHTPQDKPNIHKTTRS